MSRTSNRVYLRSRARVLAAPVLRCHLCNALIDKSLRAPHPLSASVDHVVPHALGGADDPGNLRPAHLSCNRSRQVKPIHEVATPRNSREW